MNNLPSRKRADYNVYFPAAKYSLVAILSGCASQNVDWDYDPSHTLSNLKTYAWLDTDQSKLGYDSEGLTRQRIRTAVDRELTVKGSQRIKLDAGKVDFLINDRTEVKVRQQNASCRKKV